MNYNDEMIEKFVAAGHKNHYDGSFAIAKDCPACQIEWENYLKEGE